MYPSLTPEYSFRQISRESDRYTTRDVTPWHHDHRRDHAIMRRNVRGRHFIFLDSNGMSSVIISRYNKTHIKFVSLNKRNLL